MDKDTNTVLREAQRLGWDAFAAGSGHWKLVPPGGLCETTPRPAVVPTSASDHRSWKNLLAQLRRYGTHGRVLADALDPRGNEQPKTKANGGPTHIEGAPQRLDPAAEALRQLASNCQDSLALAQLMQKAIVFRYPTQTDITIHFWGFNDDPLVKRLLELAEEPE